MAEPVVRAGGLCKSYRSGHSTIRAVWDVSFLIERGAFVAIVGRSGSGKSTLMSILGLLDRPDAGTYLLNGQETVGLHEDARAALRNREIGFVFQLPALLPRATALENAELPLAYAGVTGAERRRRAEEALDRVGLSHRLAHWPHQLSGGEQQRVAIARAIINNPALILADEPTGALDSRTSQDILALFTALHREGSTILVVTHATEVADCAHRRITIHDGHIINDHPQASRVSLVANSLAGTSS
jgi:putative ABC transport system ATP-binding protein